MKKNKAYEIHKSAGRAMREAVKKVVLAHKKSGRPLVVWKNGKVVKVSAKQLMAKN